MATYNERMAANNARLESILERVGNLSSGGDGGASHESTTFSLNQNSSLVVSKVIFQLVEDGEVVITEYTSVPKNMLIPRVLKNSFVYVELSAAKVVSFNANSPYVAYEGDPPAHQYAPRYFKKLLVAIGESDGVVNIN